MDGINLAQVRDNLRVFVNKTVNEFSTIREDFCVADGVLDFSSTAVYGVR